MSRELQLRLEQIENELRLLRRQIQLHDQSSQRSAHPPSRPWNIRPSNHRSQPAIPPNRRAYEGPSWANKPFRPPRRPVCGNEIPPLRRGPKHHLYRLTIHTYNRGERGTDGDAFFSFVGSTGASNGTSWLYCDNPHSTYHSPGDIDLYYFYNPELGDNIRFQIALESNRSPEEDHWRWEGWLHKFEEGQWLQKLHLPETDTQALDDLGCDTFRNTGAAHLDGRTKQWTTWKAAGIEFAEVPDFTPSQVRFLKMADETLKPETKNLRRQVP